MIRLNGIEDIVTLYSSDINIKYDKRNISIGIQCLCKTPGVTIDDDVLLIGENGHILMFVKQGNNTYSTTSKYTCTDTYIVIIKYKSKYYTFEIRDEIWREMPLNIGKRIVIVTPSRIFTNARYLEMEKPDMELIGKLIAMSLAFAYSEDIKKTAEVCASVAASGIYSPTVLLGNENKRFEFRNNVLKLMDI